MPDLIKNPKPHMVRSNYVDMSNPPAKKKAPAEELDAIIEESMQPAKKSAASKEGSKSSGASGAKSGDEGSPPTPTANPSRGAAPTTVTSSTTEGNAEQPGKAQDDSDWLTPMLKAAGVAATAAAVYAYLRRTGMPENVAQKMSQTAVANPAGASDLLPAATGDDPRIAQAEILALSAPEEVQERLALPAPSGASTMPDEAGVYSPGRTGTGGPVEDEVGTFSPGRTPQDPRFLMADEALSEVGAEFAPTSKPDRMVGPANRFMKQGSNVNQYNSTIPGAVDWLDEQIMRGEAPKPRIRRQAPSVKVPMP